jgi:hypothetical protein
MVRGSRSRSAQLLLDPLRNANDETRTSRVEVEPGNTRPRRSAAVAGASSALPAVGIDPKTSQRSRLSRGRVPAGGSIPGGSIGRGVVPGPEKPAGASFGYETRSGADGVTGEGLLEAGDGRKDLRVDNPRSTSTPALCGDSALDRAASAGHSCVCSSGFPLESEASATSASSVRTG